MREMCLVSPRKGLQVQGGCRSFQGWRRHFPVLFLFIVLWLLSLLIDCCCYKSEAAQIDEVQSRPVVYHLVCTV